MKKTKMATKVFSVILAIILLASMMSGCGIQGLLSGYNSFKGNLAGVSYEAEFYDNYGARFLTVNGKKIGIEGNYVRKLEGGIDLTSVITITIDGKQIESCGDTVIFAESGLKKDVDFELSEMIDSTSSGKLSELTSVARVINNYKNHFGKSQVVVIQSQLGVPICAYSGDDVYWEIPNDLPKMTKLMIDGKALYIHRANYQIIDLELIK